jgi:uncharacterized protein YkwD
MKRDAALAGLLAALAAAVTMSSAGSVSVAAGASLAGCSTRAGLGAPNPVQERAMLCLANRARRDRGLRELTAARPLARAADHKSADILRCDEFSHEACGRPFTYWMDHFGFRGCAEAENIAWGTGPLGSARSIFRAWMHSPGHRENILGPYEQSGIGLRVGRLDGYAGAHVWTQDFGAGC